MITTREFGPVTQFTMGGPFGGKPVYTMACYYVEGLLIDTGPAHVAEEIPAALAHPLAVPRISDPASWIARLDYEFKTILCGSGRVLEDGRRALAAKVEFWEHLANAGHRSTGGRES